MIIAEGLVKVPSWRYSLSIHCTNTRRLTAIEWLILTCISKFHDSSTMSRALLKNTFERVFELQDSDLLINPSLEKLHKLGVISFETSVVDYAKITFGSIELTSLGKQMLNDGLLPLSKSELSTVVWYNPLTGQINSQEIRKVNSSEAIILTIPEGYGEYFPEKEIKDKFQTGEIGSDRFFASKCMIDSIEILDTRIADSFVALLFDLDSEDKLVISPEIINDNMKTQVESLLFTRDISKSFTQTLVSKNNVDIEKVYGSGTKIIQAISDVCSNGKFLFVDRKVYEIVSEKKPELFAAKFVILFNSNQLGSHFERGAFLVSFPGELGVPGCVVVNNKNESVSLCKASLSYESRKIEYPLAIKDRRVNRNNSVLIMIEKAAMQNAKRDVAYYGLFSLPFFRAEKEIVYKELVVLWQTKSLPSVLSDIIRMSQIAIGIHQQPLDLDPIKDLLIGKVNNSNNSDQIVSDYQKIIALPGVIAGSDMHIQFVKNALQVAKRPETYVDLQKLQAKMGIKNQDIALVFDDVFVPFYDEAIVKDIFSQIMNGTDPVGVVLFPPDEYFKTYFENLHSIQMLIGGDLFKKQDENAFRKAVINCPDIALLQMLVTELSEKNAELVKNEINIYSLMLQIDQIKADRFYANLNLIEKYIVEKLKGIIPKDDVPPKTVSARIDEKVYIVDTCAIINNQELFLYFSKDEYIRLPLTVIAELGKIKDRQSKKYGRDDEKAYIARTVVNKIKNTYLTSFNIINECILMRAKADASLLPADLDPTVPDHLILSVALKYNSWDVCIITDDNQFSLVANSIGIKTITSNQFIESHKKHYCPEAYLKEKYKEADMPSSSVKEWLVNNAETEIER